MMAGSDTTSEKTKKVSAPAIAESTYIQLAKWYVELKTAQADAKTGSNNAGAGRGLGDVQTQLLVRVAEARDQLPAELVQWADWQAEALPKKKVNDRKSGRKKALWKIIDAKAKDVLWVHKSIAHSALLRLR